MRSPLLLVSNAKLTHTCAAHWYLDVSPHFLSGCARLSHFRRLNLRNPGKSFGVDLALLFLFLTRKQGPPQVYIPTFAPSADISQNSCAASVKALTDAIRHIGQDLSKIRRSLALLLACREG